jgi:hypothetical protein
MLEHMVFKGPDRGTPASPKQSRPKGAPTPATGFERTSFQVVALPTACRWVWNCCRTSSATRIWMPTNSSGKNR